MSEEETLSKSMVNKLYLSVFLLISILLVGSCPAYSEKISLNSILTPKDIDNIHIYKISSDKNSTDFLITVKKSVPLHMHVNHTETIYVLDGEAEFQENNQRYMIKQGDYLRINQQLIIKKPANRQADYGRINKMTRAQKNNIIRKD